VLLKSCKLLRTTSILDHLNPFIGLLLFIVLIGLNFSDEKKGDDNWIPLRLVFGGGKELWMRLSK